MRSGEEMQADKHLYRLVVEIIGIDKSSFKVTIWDEVAQKLLGMSANHFSKKSEKERDDIWDKKSNKSFEFWCQVKENSNKNGTRKENYPFEVNVIHMIKARNFQTYNFALDKKKKYRIQIEDEDLEDDDSENDESESCQSDHDDSDNNKSGSDESESNESNSDESSSDESQNEQSESENSKNEN